MTDKKTKCGVKAGDGNGEKNRDRGLGSARRPA